MIAAMHPAEIALLIESLPPAQREVVWNFVEPEIEADVLVELSDSVRQSFIEGMDADELLAAAENMELDDLADLVGDLPETVGAQLAEVHGRAGPGAHEHAAPVPEDTAGGLMNTDTVSVRADVTVEVVLRYLRMRGELPDKTDRLIVVDRNDRLPRHGRTDAAAHRRSGEARRRHPRSRGAAHRAGNPGQRSRKAVPGPRPRLRRGRRCSTASCWAASPSTTSSTSSARKRAHEVMSAAGLGDQEDVFAGVFPSTRRRLVWLGINLVTAFLAAAVVSRFEGTIEKVAALAALMPIVASMGGIAGPQTVTLIIRGIALGQVEWVNARWLLWKEIAVGGLNGLIWAAIVGAVTIVWYWHLEDRRDHRGRHAHQPAVCRGRGRDRAAHVAPDAHRSSAVGGRDPDHVHRLHRLRHVVRARRAVPDLRSQSTRNSRRLTRGRAMCADGSNATASTCSKPISN